MKKKILGVALASLGICALSLGTISCGSQGAQGETGAQGIQGEKGDKGDKGDTGETGATGNGIASATINSDGELILVYTDGTTVNLGKVTGTDGKDGEDGKDATDAFTIAKGFGYQGSYGDWVKEIVSGTLGVQYAVTVSSDYTSFTYGWDKQSVTLGEHAILLDSRFTDEEVASHQYIYNSVNAAIAAAQAGTEDSPMVIYMAPGVYWTHDPESTTTDQAYQITKDCANMKWVGLSDDRRNVVLAFNYGHDEGYAGANPTCFNISGDNFSVSNMTIGGYCNVDLDFALNRSLNIEKRSTNVTQCQLGTYSGDKLYCNNVSFISRLNMMPFISSKRALYVDCHMESTDDSLNGSSQAVYLNCDFDFYASKPWGGSSGVTLLNCNMNIVHINVGDNPVQYLAKGAGRFNVIDCTFTDSTGLYDIGWSDILSDTYRSYYSNVTYNGKKIDFSAGDNADKGVDLTGTDALKAYKLVNSKGTVVYNVYNLLRGSDEWDPLNQKDVVTALGGADVATTLNVSTSASSLETGKDGSDTATLSYTIKGPQSTEYASDVTWSVSAEMSEVVSLTKNDDGTWTLKATNDMEETLDVLVTARTASGLEAAVVVTVKPSILPIAQASDISITQTEDGKAYVSYTISDLGTRADNSRIIWYVCDDAEGTNPVEIAVGRSTTPLKEITLEPAWVGKYLKVSIESKHIRSEYADAATFVSSTPISATGIASLDTYHVNLATFVTDNTTAELKDVAEGYWYVNNANYATGWKNGFLDYTGLYFTGSRSSTRVFSEIDYNAVSANYTDMDVTLKLAPGKTAGQGFGSNNNFIEFRIKYDTTTKTGYSVRIVRTSGDSTKVQLVKLSAAEDGTVTSEVLTESANTSVYLTEVTVHVWTADGKLHTHIESSKEQPSTAVDKGYLASVDLEAEIEMTTNGDFGVYLESSTGDNTTFIGDIVINWTKAE